MRVLHIVPAAFGDNGVVGGAERYALELARYMSEEVSTTLVAFGDQNDEKQIGRLRFRVLGPAAYIRGQRSNPFSASLLSELRRADVTHCHQQHIVASNVASLFCRMSGRKVVVSNLGGGGWNLSGYVKTDRWYHAHLHISEYSRVLAGHAGKPWAHVIYGGVDTAKFSPAASVRREGRVLFVGRILPHKGIDYLIRALPSDMTLEIIGRPYDRRYHADLVKLAEGKQVIFRDGCDDLALVDAYRKALCVVLPSVYRTMYGDESKVPELLGQTLIEGMACGTPAICTDVASMPEVVKDRETGFVVPPNDPDGLRERLIWLRDHSSEARDMGDAARDSVLQRFLWSSVVKQCLEIYKS